MNNIRHVPSIGIELRNHCHFSQEGASLEVTEWFNGEGITGRIQTNHTLGDRTIMLTYGEANALTQACKELNWIKHNEIANFDELFNGYNPTTGHGKPYVILMDGLPSRVYNSDDESFTFELFDDRRTHITIPRYAKAISTAANEFRTQDEKGMDIVMKYLA